MSAWFGRRSRRSEAVTEAPPPDRDLVAWAEVAARVSDGLGLRGQFAVAVLGESLTRSRPTPWFGYAPDGEGLAALFAALGEGEVDTASLHDAEEPMRGRHLGSVPPALAAEWRQRLTESAARVVGEGILPGRVDDHVRAEQIWVAAAPAASRRPLPQLDPAAALSQLRWWPGTGIRTHIGYSDPLNLSTVQRATTEAGLTGEERDAQAAAQAVVETPRDPLAWRLSSLAYAATRRPWEQQ